MRDRAAAEPLVDLSEVAEIELLILKQMKERTIGDHRSAFKGQGFTFVGLRDWEPGDRTSSIDWAQSSLTNFSPIVTREFEQPSNAAIVAVADASPSTRCGAAGTPIAAAVARSVASVGLSAVFFQDLFGLITFDHAFRPVEAVRPRIGKPHVLHCLDLYLHANGREPDSGRGDLTATIEAHLRRPSLIPVISDFLFEDAPRLLADLSLLNAVHDVFLIMVDARFAYDLPDVSAGWVEVFDVETARARVLSRRELGRLAGRVEEWQAALQRLAREANLDLVRVGLDRWEMENALVQFVAERRLRKT
jgi:uncharacterized protein (DUF58 family)